MLNVPSFETVHRIGLFLKEAGYDAAHITQQLNLSEGLRADLSNLPVLFHKTEGESVIPVLARLFFVGWPVARTLCERVLTAQFLTDAHAAGLLVQKGDELEAQASIVPFADFLVVCDSARVAADSREKVVGPGRATLALARAAVRGEHETTLDIGSGSGVLAIAAADYSDQVIGSDVSPRARAFGEFSAALNGKTSVGFLCGDGLETVKGRQFSRILANPPFFLSPVKTFTFCDSPLELDGFSRRVAVEAPVHLKEGGYFQMISEWVEIKGQPWQERIREWTARSGCDVLVTVASASTAAQYAEKRFTEAKTLFGERSDESFQRHVDYFAQHQVENILLGIVTLHKRASVRNWFAVLPSCPVTRGVADAIEERMATLTFAATHSPEELLNTRFGVAADAVMDQRIVFSEGGWRAEFVDLLKTGPFEDRLRLDSSVGMVFQMFDGKKSLGEIATRLAQEASINIDQARQNCVQLCQRLLQLSLIRPID